MFFKVKDQGHISVNWKTLLAKYRVTDLLELAKSNLLHILLKPNGFYFSKSEVFVKVAYL
jgi:hypothetical protein